MATTKITSSRNAVGAINYYLHEPSHDGIHARVGAFSARNTTVFTAQKDVIENMNRYGTKDNVQAYLVIQSFATDELDPDNQEDLDKANEVGMVLARELAGDDRQIIVVTQADNGKVHNHIFMASTDTITGKALRGIHLRHDNLSAMSDLILSEYNIKNKNAELNREPAKVKQSIAEIKRREKGKYVWKDDLRNRIEESQKESKVKDDESFRLSMFDKGVDVSFHEKTRNISYKFIDEEGKTRKCRASRLGTSYGKEAIDKVYEEHQKTEEQTIFTQNWGDEGLNRLAKMFQEQKEKREAEKVTPEIKKPEKKLVKEKQVEEIEYPDPFINEAEVLRRLQAEADFENLMQMEADDYLELKAKAEAEKQAQIERQADKDNEAKKKMEERAKKAEKLLADGDEQLRKYRGIDNGLDFGR